MSPRPSDGTHTVRTAGVGFLLPEGWWVIDLTDSERRARQVRALVRRQVGPRDEHASARAGLRRDLDELTTRAADVGGTHLALCLWEVGGAPVPASLTLYRTTSDAGGVDELVRRATRDGRETEVLPGPFGDLARTVGISTGDAEHVPQLRADYWLDPDDDRGLVLLAFSSPLLPLRDDLVDLFDSIVAGVRRVDDGDATDSATETAA